MDFWAYIDARVRAKKLEAPRDGSWEWRLRLQFYNQINSEEVFLTEDAHEFYRAAGVPSTDGTPEARFAAVADKALAVIEQVAKTALEIIVKAGEHAAASVAASAKAAGDSTAASASAAGLSIAQSVAAGAAAVAEATKQTLVVSDIARAQQDEAIELKQALLALHAERTKVPQETKSAAAELRELADCAKTVMGFADSFAGPASSKPPVGDK